MVICSVCLTRGKRVEILDDQFLAILPLVVPKRTTSVTRLVKSDAQRRKNANPDHCDGINLNWGLRLVSSYISLYS